MKNAKILAATVVLVVAATFSGLLLMSWLSALTVPGMHHAANENDLLIQASVINVNPLVLFARVRSTCTDDILYLTEARIQDNNQTTVAEYRGIWIGGGDGYRRPLCTLKDFGSEETLTLEFETTLPSENYTLWFCSTMMGAVYSFAHTQFAIP